MWERKLWKNNWVKAAAVNRGESSQQNLLNNPVGREETFLQTFLVEHVKQQFSVSTFCGSVWKSWRESPNCWRCLVLAWTRKLSNYLTWWKLNRVWSSNGSELLCWFETVFLALELKFVKGRGYDTYESKGKKEAQRWVCCFHWNRDRRRRRRGSSPSYLCKQQCIQLFQMLKCT